MFLGDLERLTIQLQDTDNEKISLKERIDLLQRSQKEWEQKSTTMNITVSYLRFLPSIFITRLHFSSTQPAKNVPLRVDD